MRTLIWGKTFIKTFRRNIKKYPYLRKNIEKVPKLLIDDWFEPSLSTHKLKGKLRGGVWACSVGYDLRIIFDFIKDENNNGGNILSIGIGTHKEAY